MCILGQNCTYYVQDFTVSHELFGKLPLLSTSYLRSQLHSMTAPYRVILPGDTGKYVNNLSKLSHDYQLPLNC